MRRRRYAVNLAAHLAECEANYARLMRLMPDIDGSDRHSLSLSLCGDEPRVRFQVAERSRYTATVRATQDAPAGARRGAGAPLHGLRFVIRIYHDAKSAEVIEFQGQRRFQAVYDYPNVAMRHPDEKAQVNFFFGEFLSLCLAHGVSNDARVLAHET